MSWGLSTSLFELQITLSFRTAAMWMLRILTLKLSVALMCLWKQAWKSAGFRYIQNYVLERV